MILITDKDLSFTNLIHVKKDFDPCSVTDVDSLDTHVHPEDRSIFLFSLVKVSLARLNKIDTY